MYEPKPVKEPELKKSFSQMSLDERKTKKGGQKNSTRKKVMSAATTEGASWRQKEEETRTLKKRESMYFLLNFFPYATKLLVSVFYHAKYYFKIVVFFPNINGNGYRFPLRSGTPDFE